jgi:hypothetical protein
MGANFFSFLIPLLSVAVSAFAGLLGVYVGGIIGRKNEAKRQRVEFVTKQLEELYGPLLGLKTEIKSRWHREGFVRTAAESMWGARLLDVNDPTEREKISVERDAELKKLNERYFALQRDEVIPLYNEMKRIFLEKMWLALPTTVNLYQDLNDHIDSLDQLPNLRLSYETLLLVGPQEHSLNNFYRDIDNTIDTLRFQIGGHS